MARRISELPDDVDWPDLEDDLIPEEDPLPEAGGPFTRAFEYLHGARATIDADLTAPTRLLTSTAARAILRIADEEDIEIPETDAWLEALAEGDIPHERDDLVAALARLSSFVERQVQAASEGEGRPSRGGGSPGA